MQKTHILKQFFIFEYMLLHRNVWGGGGGGVQFTLYNKMLKYSYV